MNVYQLRDTLKNKIKNKRDLAFGDGVDPLHPVVVQFLKLNIDELERILVDVEICCKQSTRESWISNPERMGQ